MWQLSGTIITRCIWSGTYKIIWYGASGIVNSGQFFHLLTHIFVHIFCGSLPHSGMLTSPSSSNRFKFQKGNFYHWSHFLMRNTQTFRFQKIKLWTNLHLGYYPNVVRTFHALIIQRATLVGVRSS
jgi:hypothetical protein